MAPGLRECGSIGCIWWLYAYIRLQMRVDPYSGPVLAGSGFSPDLMVRGFGEPFRSLARSDLARSVGGWCLGRIWRQRRSFRGSAGRSVYAFASIMLFPAKHDTTEQTPGLCRDTGRP